MSIFRMKPVRYTNLHTDVANVGATLPDSMTKSTHTPSTRRKKLNSWALSASLAAMALALATPQTETQAQTATLPNGCTGTRADGTTIPNGGALRSGDTITCTGSFVTELVVVPGVNV